MQSQGAQPLVIGRLGMYWLVLFHFRDVDLDLLVT